SDGWQHLVRGHQQHAIPDRRFRIGETDPVRRQVPLLRCVGPIGPLGGWGRRTDWTSLARGASPPHQAHGPISRNSPPTSRAPRVYQNGSLPAPAEHPIHQSFVVFASLIRKTPSIRRSHNGGGPCTELARSPPSSRSFSWHPRLSSHNKAPVSFAVA